MPAPLLNPVRWLAGGLLAIGAVAPARSAAGEWDQASEISARIQRVQFPARNFSIADFGARPGKDSTAAIQRAIDACAAAGGGHVLVPSGTFSTGPIRLLSNVDFHLGAGSVLKFKTDPEAYLPAVFTRWEGTECMNYRPLISAFDQHNLAITGPGTLDGCADESNWWAWGKKDAEGRSPASPDSSALVALGEKDVPVEARVFGRGHHLRPNFIQCYRCENVLWSDFTVINSPMWELNPVLSSHLTIDGVRIHCPDGPNSDGFDPESCQNVLVQNCSFETGDDCISIKSGRNRDGRRVGVASENILIRHCFMKDGHAGVAIGSEVSAGCRNIFVEDCRMDSPRLERVLRIKSNATRGGTIENVFLRDIKVGHVLESIITVDFLYEEGARGNYPPVFRHVAIDRLECESSPRVLWIEGIPQATVDDIRLAHSTIADVTAPDIVTNAGKVEFDHVQIIPKIRLKSLDTRPALP